MSVKLYRGDTWLRTWVIKDKLGAIVDITSSTARLYVRDQSETLIHSASTLTGELSIIGNLGEVALRIEAVVTKLWAVGRYKFDLEVTHADGIVRTYEQNTLKIVQDETYD